MDFGRKSGERNGYIYIYYINGIYDIFGAQHSNRMLGLAMFLQQDQHCHQTCLKLLLDTGQTDNNNDINDLQRTVRVTRQAKKVVNKKTQHIFALISRHFNAGSGPAIQKAPASLPEVFRCNSSSERKV